MVLNSGRGRPLDQLVKRGTGDLGLILALYFACRPPTAPRPAPRAPRKILGPRTANGPLFDQLIAHNDRDRRGLGWILHWAGQLIVKTEEDGASGFYGRAFWASWSSAAGREGPGPGKIGRINSDPSRGRPAQRGGMTASWSASWGTGRGAGQGTGGRGEERRQPVGQKARTGGDGKKPGRGRKL